MESDNRCEQLTNVWDTCGNLSKEVVLEEAVATSKRKLRREHIHDRAPMKEIADKLASIGSPISDLQEDQAATLLGSLPPSYYTLETALEARVDDNIVI